MDRIAVLIVLVGASLLPSGNAFGQDARPLVFRTQVSELWLQTNSLAKNRQPNDFVETTLSGRLIDPPLAVSLIQRTEADWNSPEHALASIRSADTTGDPDWILENFVEPERSGVRSLLNDPEIAKRNQDYYRTLNKVEITGSAQLREYTILIVREESKDRKSRVILATFAKTAAGWRQTNALSKDETFDVVWAAVRAGHVR